MKPALAAEPGWPRERLPADIYLNGDYVTQPLPAIFAAGDTARSGDWLSFDTDNLNRCAQGACVVCGLDLGRVVLFGHTGTLRSNGPGAHPRCFAMTLKFCPHFNQGKHVEPNQTVAYVYDGPDWRKAIDSPRQTSADILGSDFRLKRHQVRAYRRAACIELAKRDPMGAGEMLDAAEPGQ